MPEYRRHRIGGGCYFFTVNLQHRGSDLLTRNIGHLRQAVRTARARQPFRINAWVVLPDHLHCVWTLPDGDDDFSGRWRRVKAAFTMSMALASSVRPSLARRREAGIWQRRFWEHAIRDEQDYAAHVDYVHFNPVKHGLVASAAAWPFSTFGRCVCRGLYPADWVMTTPELGSTGERE